MTLLLLVSGRRFIAETVLQVVAERLPGTDTRHAADLSVIRSVLADGNRCTVVFDLEDTGLSHDELTSVVTLLEGHRRVGIYDRFTAERATLAFELGLTGIVGLTSAVERIVELIGGASEMSSSTRAVGATRDQLSRLGSLSPRELEVLQLLAEGRAVRDISHTMGITAHTVQTHKRVLFQRLGVQSQSQAVAMAVVAGVVSEPR